MASALKSDKIVAMSEEIQTIISSTAEELLSSVGLQGTILVSSEEESFSVHIETDSIAMLIGRYGETISAFQYILGQLVQQKTGEWKRIVVDCGDYRKKQEDSLKNLALVTVQKVKETGEPQSVYDLTPEQRRLVHIFLAEDPEVETRSEGEGRDRYLIVDLKK